MEVEELIGRRDAIKAELLELEQAIARHPTTIKSAFAHNPLWDIDKFEELIKRVANSCRKIYGKFGLITL